MKNFIWDFDGTLFDSYPHSTKAFCMILDRHEKEYDEREVCEALQVSFGHAYEQYELSDAEISEFGEYAKMVDLKPEIIPYPEAESTLQYISDRGGVNYIFTHRDSTSLEFYLRRHGLLHLFADSVTADDGFERKPSPQGVEHIVEKHGLNKDDTVMIGDREIDILSGINAGVKGILISPSGRAESTAADRVLVKLADVISVL